MTKAEEALSYFRAGYNCSQSVLMAYAGNNDSAVKAAAAFGGGMGRLQKTCGAVTGAYIWFGMAHAASGVPAAYDKTDVYRRVQEFNRIFTERNGSDQCDELLGESLNTTEGKENIASKGLTQTVCEKCVRDAIDIIEEIG